MDMLKKLLKGFSEVFKDSITPYSPPIAEYGEALQETESVRQRLGPVIEAWEKRTGQTFRDTFEDLPPDADGWMQAQQRSFSAFFGSREYEAYRNLGVKKDIVKQEPMCKSVYLDGKNVRYHLDGEWRTNFFSSEEAARVFAKHCLNARKSIYTPPKEKQ